MYGQKLTDLRDCDLMMLSVLASAPELRAALHAELERRTVRRRAARSDMARGHDETGHELAILGEGP